MVRDDGGQRRGHAHARYDGQRVAPDAVERGERHAAQHPRHGQEHEGHDHAVPRYAEIGQHVARVEQLHVQAGALLTREEQDRDGRWHQHGAARVRGPTRGRLRGRLSVVRITTVIVGRGRWFFRAEPPFGFVGVARPSHGPEPRRRLRKHEQRDQADRRDRAHYRGHGAPVQEHGQQSDCYHSQAHEHVHHREVQRPMLGQRHFGQVHIRHRGRTCSNGTVAKTVRVSSCSQGE